MGIGVDDARSRADTLQPDRLPHDQQFTVGARGHNDHVARRRNVNRGLNRLASSHARWSLATDRDGYGVDGLLAVGGCDDQLTATRVACDAALLDGSLWH